jgi:two-component system LytT family response regulator
MLNFIKNYTPQLEVVAEANSVEMALKEIKSKKPDLVFLDIELGDGTGFDILEEVDEVDFHVIFVTAYDHYALEAFKVNAIDYLRKPVNIEEFIMAVKKVEMKEFIHSENLKNLKNEMSSKPTDLLSVSTRTGFESININSLIRCQADGKYTLCFLEDGRKILSSKNLKEFETMLTGKSFFRVHHGHLINLNKVLSFNRADSVVELDNNESVPVSQRKKKAFIQEMNLI